MNHKLNLVKLHPPDGPPLQSSLLMELDDLFRDIEDGTVKDNTFIGCIALGRRDLPPLNETQSRQIREVLLRAPLESRQLTKADVPILSSMFNFIRSLWGSHDSDVHAANDGSKLISSLLDENGRVKPRDTSPTGGSQGSQAVKREIQESDVNQFLSTQGEDYAWVTPYTWDIANRLNAIKKLESDGDLGLFLERRRKLNVRRPKSTRFEQSVQRYAAGISELYCDENGDITDEKSLEAFIGDLVVVLLDKTKTYWPTSPLLAIFDGLVVTVIRPLLHGHRTFYFPGEMTTADGVIVSGNMVGKVDQLETVPKWNDKSQRLVARYVKKAFKKQVSNFFLDRYAPYNREYARSPHLEADKLANVGLLVKSFGNPIHLKHVMELLQPTNQEDELAQYVVDHFRGDDFIDH